MQETSQQIRPDICVIGTGAGGLAAAAAAAAFGVNVVLIENGGMGDAGSGAGGPAAERANAYRDGARFGVKSARYGVDFAAVRAHVHDVLAAVAPARSRERFN